MKNYTRLFLKLIAGACLILSCDKKTEDPLPQASFTFEQITSPGQVIFHNTSKNASVFKWDFGHPTAGNNESAEFSPTHDFPGNDNFTVKLTADPSMPHPFSEYSQVVTITGMINLYGTYNLTTFSITGCANPGGNYPVTACGTPGVFTVACSQFVGTNNTIVSNGQTTTYTISGSSLITTYNGVSTASTFTLSGNQLSISTPTSAGCVLTINYTKV